MTTTDTRHPTITRQLARLNADLAPCDEVREQAIHTARLRGDETYLARWDAHEAKRVILTGER